MALVTIKPCYAPLTAPGRQTLIRPVLGRFVFFRNPTIQRYEIEFVTAPGVFNHHANPCIAVLVAIHDHSTVSAKGCDAWWMIGVESPQTMRTQVALDWQTASMQNK